MDKKGRVGKLEWTPRTEQKERVDLGSERERLRGGTIDRAGTRGTAALYDVHLFLLQCT